MEITTSQSKAQEAPAKPEAEQASSHTSADDDRYLDRSGDLVARVRATREAAQRRMDAFGNVADYDVRVVRGRKSESQA